MAHRSRKVPSLGRVFPPPQRSQFNLLVARLFDGIIHLQTQFTSRVLPQQCLEKAFQMLP